MPLRLITVMNLISEVISSRMSPLAIIGVMTLSASVGVPYVNAQIDNTATGVGALVSITTGDRNTADGANALNLDTSGSDNTAIGAHTLESNTSGGSNGANGSRALQNNTTGSSNTATGVDALRGNTTGSSNTATGRDALFSNTNGTNNMANGSGALALNASGGGNTASGRLALHDNTTGNYNTASGYNALFSNTTGTSNLANGNAALYSNTTGVNNMATGASALYANTTGFYNMANGSFAGFSNTTGNYNVAEGLNALYSNTTGSNNIAIGTTAGGDLTTGGNNIDIGNRGVAGESGRIRLGTHGMHTNTYIAGISGVAVAGGVSVVIDTNGHLGTVVSSARYKEEIKPMDKASETIHSLQPVTFRYRNELDPQGIPQFGLVAEEVEKIDPNLVAYDEQGKPYTVRYEAVNAMLLNEFLKEHSRVEEQGRKERQLEAMIQQLQKEIGALSKALKEQAAQIQKVSAKVSAENPAAQMIADIR